MSPNCKDWFKGKKTFLNKSIIFFVCLFASPNQIIETCRTSKNPSDGRQRFVKEKTFHKFVTLQIRPLLFVLSRFFVSDRSRFFSFWFLFVSCCHAILVLILCLNKKKVLLPLTANWSISDQRRNFDEYFLRYFFVFCWSFHPKKTQKRF